MINRTILCALLFASVAFGEIIPAERRYPWTPGVNVGVPSGIPTSRTMFCDATVNIPGSELVVESGWPDNMNSQHAALEAALTLCPEDQYVYLPAGFYYIDSTFSFAGGHNRTLKGAGPDQTILMFANEAYFTDGGVDDNPFPGITSSVPPSPVVGVTISSGATRGSASVVVTDRTVFTEGCFARFDVTNPPTYIKSLSEAWDLAGDATLNFLVMVTGISPGSGSTGTITFEPELPMDISSLTPVLVPFFQPPTRGLGIEDLTFNLSQGNSDFAVKWENVYGCWMKNIEVKNSISRQVWLFNAMFCEIRHSIFHHFGNDTTLGGNNSEGVDLVGYCVGVLIEDIISNNGGFPGIMLGDGWGGCYGNVIGYNFCRDVAAGDGAYNNWGNNIGTSHGRGNGWNLVEGNIAGGISLGDGWHGNTMRDTAFRNWATAIHYRVNSAGTVLVDRGTIRALEAAHYSYQVNFVGNILGDATWLTTGDPYFEAPEVVNYDSGGSNGAKALWFIGRPYVGGTGYTPAANIAATTPPDYTDEDYNIQTGTFGLDFNVAVHMIRHGNYDYHNTEQSWDPAILDQSIPDSLYTTKAELIARGVALSSYTFPPVNPSEAAQPLTANSATFAAMLPAGYRFVNGTDPTGRTPTPTYNRLRFRRR